MLDDNVEMRFDVSRILQPTVSHDKDPVDWIFSDPLDLPAAIDNTLVAEPEADMLPPIVTFHKAPLDNDTTPNEDRIELPDLVTMPSCPNIVIERIDTLPDINTNPLDTFIDIEHDEHNRLPPAYNVTPGTTLDKLEFKYNIDKDG